MLIFIFLFYAIYYANNTTETPLELIEGKEEYSLNEYLYYYEDHTADKSFLQIYQENQEILFKKNENKNPNFGYTDSAYWVKFKVNNSSNNNSSWWLELEFANMHKIDLYFYNEEGILIEKNTGLLYPMSTRDVNHQKFYFKIPLTMDQSKEIFIRMENDGSMTFPMKWLSEKRGIEKILNESLLSGILYGIAIIMLIYNIFLAFSLRNKEYIYSLLFIFSFLLFQISYDGLFSRFISEGNEFILPVIPTIFAYLIMILFLKLTNVFLETKKYCRTMNIINNILIIIGLLFIIVSILSLSTFLIVYALIWGVICFSVILINLFVYLYKGIKGNNYFLISSIFFCFSSTTTILTRLGIFYSNSYTENAYKIAGIFLILFLSLAMANRIKKIKEEKDKALKNELRAIKENERLIKNQNIILEEKIEEKTKELQLDIENRKETEKKLRKERNFVNTLIDTAKVIILLLDKELKIILFNDYFEDLSGYKLEEVKGKKWDEIFLPESSKNETIDIIKGRIKEEKSGSSIDNIITKDNKELIIEWYDNPFINEYGVVEGLLSVGVNITDKIETENALNVSRKKFASIVSAAPDAIFVINDRGIITFANKASEEMFDYKYDEMIGNELHSLIVNKNYISDYRKGMKKFEKTGIGKVIGKKIELTALKKNKEEFPVEITISSFKSNDKWNAIGIIRNISVRKKAEESINELLKKDTLTECYNRRYGFELLEKRMQLCKRDKSPLLIGYLDIDDFKEINDTYGHQEGDKVLVESVNALNKCIRDVDILYRTGGDEFIIAFHNTTLENKYVIKNRIIEELTSLNEKNILKMNITLSIGFSQYSPNNPKSLDELINIADKCMYQNKKKK